MLPIKALQSPTIYAIYNRVDGLTLKSGILFVKKNHKDPCTLVDTETGKKYSVTIGLEPGTHYEATTDLSE